MLSKEFSRECRKAHRRYLRGAPKHHHTHTGLEPKGLGHLRRWALGSDLPSIEHQNRS